MLLVISRTILLIMLSKQTWFWGNGFDLISVGVVEYSIRIVADVGDLFFRRLGRIPSAKVHHDAVGVLRRRIIILQYAIEKVRLSVFFRWCWGERLWCSAD